MVLDAQPVEILKQEKFLVDQTAFLGDAILSLPFIQSLKKLNPGSLIDIITSPKCEEIFESSPAVNRIYVLDKRGKHKSIWNTIKFAAEMKGEDYSRLYSLHRSMRTSLLVLYSGIKKTYGFANSVIPWVYKNRIKYHHQYHEVQRNLALLENQELVENWKILPEMILSDKQKNSVDMYLMSYPGNENIIAIAPGSIWETKKYPAENYFQLIDYFSRTGFTIFLIGGQEEATICDGFIMNERVHNLCGKFSVAETKTILESCKLIITNDSALTHLGVAANIPVLTIYCSTIPGFGFYPYHEKGYFIGVDDLDCKPCGIHGHHECPLKHFNCGYLLDTKLVIQKAEIILNDNEATNAGN